MRPNRSLQQTDTGALFLGLVRRQEGQVLEKPEAFEEASAEGDVVAGEVTVLLTVHYTNPFSPVLNASLLVCSRDGVVEDKPEESSDEHVRGEQHDDDLVQLFDSV